LAARAQVAILGAERLLRRRRRGTHAGSGPNLGRREVVQMRVDLGAKVRTNDGQEAGSVQRAILDPDRREVTDFVVSTGGLLGRDVIVPRDQLEEASRDGETIVLKATKDELNRLPTYAPADYVLPTAGWLPPAGYGIPAGGFLLPATYPLPGEEGPQMASRGAEEDRREAKPSPEIEKGSAVVDSDGDDIGVVDDLRFDQQGGRLIGLTVRLGGALRTLLGGGEVAEVASQQIESVEEGVVRLRVHKDDLKRAA
jgi:sporulation protein YlmC with PRC-barrel domain